MNLIWRKLASLVVVVLAVSAVTYLMLGFLPGDVAFVIAGREATPADIQAVREDLGLDRPLVARYVSWLGKGL